MIMTMVIIFTSIVMSKLFSDEDHNNDFGNIVMHKKMFHYFFSFICILATINKIKKYYDLIFINCTLWPSANINCLIFLLIIILFQGFIYAFH